MTKEDIITFGKKYYGEKYVAALARDLGFSTSSILRVITGETPEVSARMVLAMEKLMRQHRFKSLTKPDVRYE